MSVKFNVAKAGFCYVISVRPVNGTGICGFRDYVFPEKNRIPYIPRHYPILLRNSGNDALFKKVGRRFRDSSRQARGRRVMTSDSQLWYLGYIVADGLQIIFNHLLQHVCGHHT